jgi:clan AA aspartic protease (TIGR02281 family)
MKALVILVAFFSFLMAGAYADTIHLKNGKSFQGLISKEDGNTVEINVGGGTIVFRAGEIERIDRAAPSEIEKIKKDWEAGRAQSEKTNAHDREAKEKALERWVAMVEEERRQGEEKRHADENTRIIPVTSDNGHVVVEAVLNGDSHALLIIDTGCPNVLLTARMGRKLGLDLEGAQDAREVMVLDGKHRVRGTLLKSVKLGDLEEKNVMADVMLEDTPGHQTEPQGWLVGNVIPEEIQYDAGPEKDEIDPEAPLIRPL